MNTCRTRSSRESGGGQFPENSQYYISQFLFISWKIMHIKKDCREQCLGKNQFFLVIFREQIWLGLYFEELGQYSKGHVLHGKWSVGHELLGADVSGPILRRACVAGTIIGRACFLGQISEELGHYSRGHVLLGQYSGEQVWLGQYFGEQIFLE